MTTKEIFLLVQEELYAQNVDTEIKEDEIVWTDHYGAENSVSAWQTAVSDNGWAAWWILNDVGNDMVKIWLCKDTVITWHPPLNTIGHPAFGVRLQFFENFLIVRYHDKHRERFFIFNIHTLNKTEIFFMPSKFKSYGNELIVGKSFNNQLLKITTYPDRMEKEEVDEEYMKIRNIKFD